MNRPPAHIPEQPWSYPPAMPAAHHAAAAPVGGYYARGQVLTVPQSTAPAPPIWDGKKRKGLGKRIALLSVATLGALVVIFFAMLESGLAGTFVGVMVALIPLAVVIATVLWLDRWEPEPRLYLVIAFAWGAGVATAAALYINTAAFGAIARSTGDAALAELIGVGLVAPISEEILKGGFLLALLLWRRRLMNSAVDLVVYAAMIASGFAFTENIMYFARGSSQGVLGAVFFGRAIMSPFAHIMFTSATALVLATVLYSRREHLWWAFPLGLALAIGLHAAWNITASIAGAQFFTVFLVLHVPIFLGFAMTVILLRRRERRSIINSLNDYAKSGWFAVHEVAMLGSLSQRSQARSWAGRFGVRAGEQMRQFQSAATSLGLNRHRMVQTSRRNVDELPGLVARERALLSQIQESRSQFLAAAGNGAARS